MYASRTSPRGHCDQTANDLKQGFSHKVLSSKTPLPPKGFAHSWEDAPYGMSIYSWHCSTHGTAHPAA